MMKKLKERAKKLVSSRSLVNLGLIAFMIIMFVDNVYATGGGGTSNADTLWGEIKGVITTWTNRLGGVIMFIGGIMFALGWRSEDAEQRSKGIQTVIAGALVLAVVGIIDQFFK